MTALGKSIAVDSWDVYWLDENASVIWEEAESLPAESTAEEIQSIF